MQALMAKWHMEVWQRKASSSTLWQESSPPQRNWIQSYGTTTHSLVLLLYMSIQPVLSSSPFICTCSSTSHQPKHFYLLSVYARDGGLPPNFAKAVVRVEVQDVNDNAPVFAKQWYSLEVPENQAPVELCFLKATDPDSGPGGELEYRITGENQRCVSSPSVLLEWRDLVHHNCCNCCFRVCRMWKSQDRHWIFVVFGVSGLKWLGLNLQIVDRPLQLAACVYMW